MVSHRGGGYLPCVFIVCVKRLRGLLVGFLGFLVSLVVLYHPLMPTTSILGHIRQRDALMEDLKRGNVAHAYLFAGPPHVGKFTVAKWFAEQLLTVGATMPKERVAEEARKLIHPDLLVLDKLWMEDTMDDWAVLSRYSNVPQNHRAKSKAKTDTISIDDVRALQERLQETGTGTFRCCLIRSVERMQDEAVNALLKIVEEPPAGVVFLLTTQSSASLLPTLVSRSRVVGFARLPARELEPMLAGIPDDDASFIRAVAQGAPGVARTLIDDPDLLRKERTLHAQAVAFWRAKTLGERLRILAPLEKRGEDGEKLLLHLSLTLQRSLATAPTAHVERLLELVRGLETNASRPLLLQRFAVGSQTHNA